MRKRSFWIEVWPGVFIEEGNLARRVFNLRQVLGDSPDERPYIETIPKRGYRFIATVRGDAEPTPLVVAEISQQEQSRGILRQTKHLWLFSLALVGVLHGLAALVAAWYFWQPRTASAQKIMLVVLPFENLSGDPPDDYFADGLTEEMITQLGQLQPAQLGVIARTSAMRYKNSSQSAAQICRELGVNYLLEGSVRQSGPRVRIAAQLIQASDQTHLWAESYETSVTDILKVQRNR